MGISMKNTDKSSRIQIWKRKFRDDLFVSKQSGSLVFQLTEPNVYFKDLSKCDVIYEIQKFFCIL